MKKIVLILLLSTLSFAASKFSNPQPSFDEPRKVVIRLSTHDKDIVNHTLNTIYNIQKEYPAESLHVVVTVYGPGMRVIKKDYDPKVLARIRSLMEYDFEFIGCRNTMETMHWKDKDFIEGVSFVQAGVVEYVEKQVAGYIGVIPY